ESTSRMLGATAEHLLEAYGGDLRKLRDEAERDPERERALLKECKGVGDVGVDVFFREVQLAWDELYPFADARVSKAAKRLELGKDARALVRLTSGRREYARLAAGLVRVDLEH